jgi:hypothetical protein
MFGDGNLLALEVKEMKNFVNVRILLMSLMALSLMAAPAFAEYIFEAEMTGDQEIVPSGSTAYGMATVIMNDAMTQIAYTVNFAGLDAPQTAAGFFMGANNEEGTEVLSLPVDVPLAGIWEITPEIAEALLDEGFYINIFSDMEMFPHGEIRGNFTNTMVQDEASSLDQVKALYR